MLGIDAQANAAAVRQRVGVLPEGYGFNDPLTGHEYVEWAVETKQAIDDPVELLDLVGLTAERDRLASGYSKGMQQRLALAMALVGDPDLLILDEPSTGLDPNGIKNMREIIADEAANGTTVFFSSHDLAQVEAVCDRVGVMNEGRLVAVDTIETLRQNAGSHATIHLECATAPTDIGVSSLDGVAEAIVDNRLLTVHCTDPSVKEDVVLHVADQTSIEDIISESVSLEALFSELTDGGRDDKAPSKDRTTMEASP